MSAIVVVYSPDADMGSMSRAAGADAMIVQANIEARVQ